MTQFSDVISRLTRRHSQASLQQTSKPQSPGSEPPPPTKGTAQTPSEGDGEEEKKDGPCEPCEQSQMKPCLTTFDLVSLGVGSCLGTGMYLTTGKVASTMTGPSGVASIFVAGVFSMLTGLCYAELAGCCPKTSGSAYMYAYITLGELAAFVIGWGLIVEYVIGTAAGAVALSETLSSLSEDYLLTFMELLAHAIGLPKLDLVAASICLLLTLLLASGAEMSARVNNVLNLTNITVLLFFAIVSLVLGSARNWIVGGFLPFGMSGMIHAIPTCYFAYIGFDTVAATGAEAQDPSRSVPRSILLSICFNCLAYVIVISCLTYCLPFYLLHHDTAMTDVFPQLGFKAGKYLVAVGAVSGEFAATFGSMFPLPRVLSTMAADGLVFRVLSKICPKRRTPVRATLLSGFVAMVMATFFDLELLIELVLIGTLLAYVMVTFALLHMRYVIHEPRIRLAEPVSVSDSGTATRENTDSDSSQPPGKEEAQPGEGITVHRRKPTPPRKQPTISRSLEQTPKKKDKSRSFMGVKNFPYFKRVGEKTHTQDGDRQNKNVPVVNLKRNSLPLKQKRSLSEALSIGAKQFRFSRGILTKRAEQSGKYSPVPEVSSSEDEQDVLGNRGRDNIKNVDNSTKQKREKIPDAGNVEEITEKPDCVSDLNPDSKTGPRRPSGARGLAGTSEERSDSATQEKSIDLAGKNYNSITPQKTLPHRTSWLKALTDFTDKISLSPKKTICVLACVYGVGIVLCSVMTAHWTRLADGNWVAIVVFGLLSAILLVLVGAVCFMQENPKGKEFRAPLVPALPVLVALFNIHLMTTLSLVAWLLFAAWMAIGLCVYFFYGIRHSSAGEACSNYQLVSLKEVPVTLQNSSTDPEEEVTSLNE